MSADLLVNRYRTFLLLVAGFSCVFTVVELWLEEHTGSPTQLIPFILCGLGVAAIAAAPSPSAADNCNAVTNCDGRHPCRQPLWPV